MQAQSRSHSGYDSGRQEQTMMWAQSPYISDSGIHSGATTNAPSLSGK